MIATACAACPELHCERPGCGTFFCYHCKAPWHANQTCDEARRERGGFVRSSVQHSEAPFKRMLIFYSISSVIVSVLFGLVLCFEMNIFF